MGGQCQRLLVPFMPCCNPNMSLIPDPSPEHAGDVFGISRYTGDRSRIAGDGIVCFALDWSPIFILSLSPEIPGAICAGGLFWNRESAIPRMSTEDQDANLPMTVTGFDMFFPQKSAVNLELC